ncbi:hypothetical protein OPKNFCMD_3424 [Methylobacterium crusticola]|uniref:CopG family transcriptional regulator n=1 Tax=Methylobacterium crusticola TaxID=1697972 RepID=A0ABQ4R0J5_9HYPH|nr:hypothetical protein [Methylobacterium crusticola]GJD50679.1 hypothetical protein OPKNFCMD_3424 [Methylobacterium crusticola]
MPDPTTPDSPRDEAFHIPDDIAAALSAYAAVEQLTPGAAICAILGEYLRAKGYLRSGPPAQS